jgi:hypothetical protein
MTVGPHAGGSRGHIPASRRERRRRTGDKIRWGTDHNYIVTSGVPKRCCGYNLQCKLFMQIYFSWLVTQYMLQMMFDKQPSILVTQYILTILQLLMNFNVSPKKSVVLLVSVIHSIIHNFSTPKSSILESSSIILVPKITNQLSWPFSLQRFKIYVLQHIESIRAVKNLQSL